MFSPPRTFKLIRYFNEPAVDRDVSQPEELKFPCIKGKLAGTSFEEFGQLLQAIDAIFHSIENVTLERTFQE
jgi:hypothetical protein